MSTKDMTTTTDHAAASMSPLYLGPGERHDGPTVMIRTLCTRCLATVDCEWPKEMSWAGLSVTPQEYMANALRTGNADILCDDCLRKSPDVKVEDIMVSDLSQ